MITVQINVIQWQPITGCSYRSPGCINCKAMKLASPELKEHFHSEGLVKDSKSGSVWTGQMRFSEERLLEPLSVSEPSAFYVCPHGDLFHENVPVEWLDKVFDVIAKCPSHWFQILTKRSRRQRDYLTDRFGDKPLHNVGIGVSCERQQEADERLPHLIKTPARIRYATFYPLLGPIDIGRYLDGSISTVLAGEEEERPANHKWIDRLHASCVIAGIPFINSSELVGER